MEFRLLGDFAAVRDGEPVRVGRRRQERLLLAILLLEAGRPVTIDRLTGLLWDGAPPAGARAAVHTYVGRLRAALSEHGVVIATKGGGYAAVGAEADTSRFTGLARAAAGAGDPAERVRLGTAALALWRGPLLADLADEPLRRRIGGPLQELRLTTAETCAQALLDMGRHDRVVRDLADLAAAHPVREGLVANVMTALYRSARQADALHLYDRAGKTLAGELGVAPGPELETVHQRILAGDPRLERPSAPVYAVRVRDLWLPWSVGGHPALEFCNTYAGWAANGCPAPNGCGATARWSSGPATRACSTTPPSPTCSTWPPGTRSVPPQCWTWPATCVNGSTPASPTGRTRGRSLRSPSTCGAPPGSRCSAWARTGWATGIPPRRPGCARRCSPSPAAPANCSPTRAGSPCAPAPVRAAAGCSSTTVDGVASAAPPPAARPRRGEAVVSAAGETAAMRRMTSLAVASATAAILATVPASAAVGRDDRPIDNGWEPVPSAPFDQAAGVTCDFPVHGEPVVDRVMKMVLEKYPDGSAKREMYTGALILRVTNKTTGASIEVDISGSGVADYKPGGSLGNNVTMRAHGPILLGMREGLGNLPRGLYVPNGIYTLRISKTGYRTVKFTVGGADPICDDLER
jgi:DNA-binding SARP family transcriptional activator